MVRSSARRWRWPPSSSSSTPRTAWASCCSRPGPGAGCPAPRYAAGWNASWARPWWRSASTWPPRPAEPPGGAQRDAAGFPPGASSGGNASWCYLRWKASVLVGVGSKKPTAQVSVEETADTPVMVISVLLWRLGTGVQAVPSQRKVTAWVTAPLGAAWPVPTATALSADVAVTPSSWLSSSGLGLDTWLQLVPSQCRIKLRSAVPSGKNPTAHALVGEVAATLVS